MLNYRHWRQRGLEQWRRYVVDLSDQRRYTRVGRCVPVAITDPNVTPADSVCWVYFRIPFRSPDDTLNVPLLRRAQALRVTMISSIGVAR